MFSRTVAAAIGAVALVVPIGAAGAHAADDATLLRVFLTDGTSLVSYGEPARVGDRVIFSMPTETTANPPLHLVNLPADRVDWDRTNRYAATARMTRYVQTQAEDDYAALSNQVATTLNQVAHTPDPVQRLAIVEEARRTLADWPQNHYGYRQAEVRQMLSLLDEAIADLRAARGARPVRSDAVRVCRPSRHRRAAAAAADAEGSDRAGARGRARRGHGGRAHIAAGHRRGDDRPRQGRPSRRLGRRDTRGCVGRHARGAATRPFVPAAHRADDGVGEPARPHRRTCPDSSGCC